ncbi:hypothetical protein GCM10010521_68520 [Streptomyces rameus]|uniref:Uncharacterized protein n=1 Tax=Streptomyces rameus TaxID=68261 RepID=A0ABN3V6F9_9ACTN
MRRLAEQVPQVPQVPVVRSLDAAGSYQTRGCPTKAALSNLVEAALDMRGSSAVTELPSKKPL